MKLYNKRVINQIRAALEFWIAIAEVSERHPSRHKDVVRYFERFTPMSVAEIKAFLDDPASENRFNWDSIPRMAQRMDVCQRKLYRQVYSDQLKPLFTHGNVHFYEDKALLKCVEKIRRRERRKAKRNETS